MTTTQCKIIPEPDLHLAGPSKRLTNHGLCQVGPKRPGSERHRHRFEFNNDFKELLEKGGLVVGGLSPDGRLVEVTEVADHPWMVGTQAHPEFLSRPYRPHPLFSDFIAAVNRVFEEEGTRHSYI